MSPATLRRAGYTAPFAMAERCAPEQDWRSESHQLHRRIMLQLIDSSQGEEHLGKAVEAKEHVVKLMEETLYGKAKSLEEYLSVDTLDERMKGITLGMRGLSVNNRPCIRPSATKFSQVLAEKGGSCQTCSSHNRSVTKQISGDDSESGLMTQSDTQMRSQTDPDNTQTGSQTDSGHPESLSHTPSKHSRSSDHAQDEVTSPMRGTVTAICVQSAPPLQWSEVLALGYIPEDWLPPKLPRREQIVESQCSRLQLLHHAFHCSESQETCHYGRGCVATKHLWQHMLACDTADCDPRCVSGKQLVMHHQTCQCSACPICVPVRANIAEEQMLVSVIQQQHHQQRQQQQQKQQASSSQDSCCSDAGDAMTR